MCCCARSNVSEGELGLFTDCRFDSTPMRRFAPNRVFSSKTAVDNREFLGYAISGDLPIVLLRITDTANIDLVRQLVKAHAYWRLQGPCRRSRDLERGPRGLPAASSRQHHGNCFFGYRSQFHRLPGRHFCAYSGADSGGGPGSFPNCRPRHHHRRQGTLEEQVGGRKATQRSGSSSLRAPLFPNSFRRLRRRATIYVLQRTGRIHSRLGASMLLQPPGGF